MKTFKNPWNHPRSLVGEFYRVTDDTPKAILNDIAFYTTESGSIIAVRNEEVLTECVTVQGAIRKLNLDNSALI